VGQSLDHYPADLGGVDGALPPVMAIAARTTNAVTTPSSTMTFGRPSATLNRCRPKR
jgi:hypothetical protein